MKKISLSAFVLFSFLMQIVSAQEHAVVATNNIHSGGGAVHWSYDGEAGPEHWCDLSAEFSGCKGANQSPINITKAVKALLPDIEFDYKDAPLKIVNNGHTIQDNFNQ